MNNLEAFLKVSAPPLPPIPPTVPLSFAAISLPISESFLTFVQQEL